MEYVTIYPPVLPRHVTTFVPKTNVPILGFTHKHPVKLTFLVMDFSTNTAGASVPMLVQSPDPSQKLTQCVLFVISPYHALKFVLTPRSEEL
jgi:hypothetical protein